MGGRRIGSGGEWKKTKQRKAKEAKKGGT